MLSSEMIGESPRLGCKYSHSIEHHHCNAKHKADAADSTHGELGAECCHNRQAHNNNANESNHHGFLHTRATAIAVHRINVNHSMMFVII